MSSSDMIVSALVVACGDRPLASRALATFRCSSDMSLRVRPLRTLGTKYQSCRWSESNSKVALVRWSGVSESRNLRAAAAMSLEAWSTLTLALAASARLRGGASAKEVAGQSEAERV